MRLCFCPPWPAVNKWYKLYGHPWNWNLLEFLYGSLCVVRSNPSDCQCVVLVLETDTWYLSKFHGRCLTPYAGEPSVITNWQPTMSGRKGKITISLFCFYIRKHMYLGPYRPCWFWAMELKEMGISIYQSSTLLMKWYIKVDHANMVAVLLESSHIYIGSWQWGVTATSFFWGKQEGLPPYWTLLNFKEQSLPNTTQETKKETKKISKITQSCLAITATESLDLF